MQIDKCCVADSSSQATTFSLILWPLVLAVSIVSQHGFCSAEAMVTSCKSHRKSLNKHQYAIWYIFMHFLWKHCTWSFLCYLYGGSDSGRNMPNPKRKNSPWLLCLLPHLWFGIFGFQQSNLVSGTKMIKNWIRDWCDLFFVTPIFKKCYPTSNWITPSLIWLLKTSWTNRLKGTSGKYIDGWTFLHLLTQKVAACRAYIFFAMKVFTPGGTCIYCRMC